MKLLKKRPPPTLRACRKVSNKYKKHRDLLEIYKYPFYLLQNIQLSGIIELSVAQRGKPSALFFSREVTRMLVVPQQKGQGLVEYALILVLVAVVVIAILLLLGPAIGNIFSTIINAI